MRGRAGGASAGFRSEELPTTATFPPGSAIESFCAVQAVFGDDVVTDESATIAFPGGPEMPLGATNAAHATFPEVTLTANETAIAAAAILPVMS